MLFFVNYYHYFIYKYIICILYFFYKYIILCASYKSMRYLLNTLFNACFFSLFVYVVLHFFFFSNSNIYIFELLNVFCKMLPRFVLLQGPIIQMVPVLLYWVHSSSILLKKLYLVCYYWFYELIFFLVCSIADFLVCSVTDFLLRMVVWLVVVLRCLCCIFLVVIHRI